MTTVAGYGGKADVAGESASDHQVWGVMPLYLQFSTSAAIHAQLTLGTALSGVILSLDQASLQQPADRLRTAWLGVRLFGNPDIEWRHQIAVHPHNNRDPLT